MSLNYAFTFKNFFFFYSDTNREIKSCDDILVKIKEMIIKNKETTGRETVDDIDLIAIATKYHIEPHLLSVFQYNCNNDKDTEVLELDKAILNAFLNSIKYFIFFFFKNFLMNIQDLEWFNYLIDETTTNIQDLELAICWNLNDAAKKDICCGKMIEVGISRF